MGRTAPTVALAVGSSLHEKAHAPVTKRCTRIWRTVAIQSLATRFCDATEIKGKQDPEATLFLTLLESNNFTHCTVLCNQIVKASSQVRATKPTSHLMRIANF